MKTKNEDDEKLHMAPGTHFFNTVFVLPGSVVLAYTSVEVASLETLKFEVFWRHVAKIVVFPSEKSRRSRSSSESDSLGNGRIKFRKHLGIKTNWFTTGSWQPFFKKEKMPWRSIPWRWNLGGFFPKKTSR